jgi:hypothetical protein
MKKLISTMVLAAGMLAAAGKPQVFTGVITDSMCGAKHAMGIAPDAKCVRECVKMDPAKWKYALLVGKDLYVLSDQQTPEKFAAQKVTVTGTLFEKTKIIEVDKIEAATVAESPAGPKR